jgi:hypothetical protein
MISAAAGAGAGAAESAGAGHEGGTLLIPQHWLWARRETDARVLRLYASILQQGGVILRRTPLLEHMLRVHCSESSAGAVL